MEFRRRSAVAAPSTRDFPKPKIPRMVLGHQRTRFKARHGDASPAPRLLQERPKMANRCESFAQTTRVSSARPGSRAAVVHRRGRPCLSGQRGKPGRDTQLFRAALLTYRGKSTSPRRNRCRPAFAVTHPGLLLIVATARSRIARGFLPDSTCVRPCRTPAQIDALDRFATHCFRTMSLGCSRTRTAYKTQSAAA